MVEEVSGVILGGFTPSGSWLTTSPSRSLNIWRARNTSVPSLNTTVMMDNPWMDSERNDSWRPNPLMAVSTSRVTSTSTCSGARPGASVWMETWGGTKSGNTSNLACEAMWIP